MGKFCRQLIDIFPRQQDLKMSWQDLTISCKLSPMEMSNPASWEKYFKMSSAENLPRLLCIKPVWLRSIRHALYHLSLTLALLNPNISYLYKQCRFRSVGFIRSQLIWICTVCNSVCEYVSTTWIKSSDWLTIRNGRGSLIYSAWQGLI